MVFENALPLAIAPSFQYSLCRVVLMVSSRNGGLRLTRHFQYSLCRVVLMVSSASSRDRICVRLSVLALSSRFDGHIGGD